MVRGLTTATNPTVRTFDINTFSDFYQCRQEEAIAFSSSLRFSFSFLASGVATSSPHRHQSVTRSLLTYSRILGVLL